MKDISITSLQQHFNQRLENYFETLNSESSELIEAMAYSTLGNSKRLRPLLVYATGLSLDIPLEMLDSTAIAIELIHTYSLIHDDLPAMDDDELRRGKPSNHIQFSEATAILAGDALQGLALETLLEDPLLDDVTKNQKAIHLLKACGYQGMIAGQNLDITLLSSPTLSIEMLKKIHLLKTACLLNACIYLPIIQKPRIKSTIKKRLEQLGSLLGLAFQIQDDYLDRYGNSQALGKTIGSDLNADKKTFADFYEQSELYALIENYYQQAENCLTECSTSIFAEIIAMLRSRQS